MIVLIMGSAFLFGGLLLFGALGLLVEWIAYRMEVKERKKVRAAEEDKTVTAVLLEMITREMEAKR